MSTPTNTRLSLTCLAIAILLSASATASAQIILVDFGAGNNPMDPGDDPANTWNNVSESVATSNTGQLVDLITTTNAPSDIDLFMVARFNGSNINGTPTSVQYPSDATRDSLFGNTELFGGLSNIFPEFRLASLDPLLTYNITFYASRLGVSDNRETQYTVTGSSTGMVFLNIANNVDNQVTLFGVSPSALGEISIRLTPGPANNNANHFTYLGVLRLEAIPEPSSAILIAGGATLLGLMRRRHA